MKLIGLAGPAGAGKDTAASVFETLFGWRAFAFSDELYAQVSEAFGVPVMELKDRRTKEKPSEHLAIGRCNDVVALKYLYPTASKKDEEALPARLPGVRSIYLRGESVLNRPRSPREILQWWGTEFRRAQDDSYWLAKAQETLWNGSALCFPGMVNTDVRFPNEASWIRGNGGIVVHVERPGFEPVNNHVAETPVERQPEDKTILNNAGLVDLSVRVAELEAELSEKELADARV